LYDSSLWNFAFSDNMKIRAPVSVDRQALSIFRARNLIKTVPGVCTNTKFLEIPRSGYICRANRCRFETPKNRNVPGESRFENDWKPRRRELETRRGVYINKNENVYNRGSLWSRTRGVTDVARFYRVPRSPSVRVVGA